MTAILLALLLLGLIQGIAEFLPISSSGHLAVFQQTAWFRESVGGGSAGNELLIGVLLHLSSLIAILIYLRNDIIKIITGAFKNIINKDFKGADIKIIINIIIATIPAGIIGAAFHDWFEAVFSSPLIVFFMLITNGIILISAKKITLKSRKLEETGPAKALLVGIFQAVAIIPGISRSGMTITGGIASGLAPEESARFSFLMAVPVIAGAGLLEGLKAAEKGVPSEMITPVLAAMVLTVAVSLLSLRLLFYVVRRARLDLFGYYTILAGLLGIILFSFFK